MPAKGQKKGTLTQKETICMLAYMTNGGNKLQAGKAAGYKATNKDNMWLVVDRCLRRPLVQKTMRELIAEAEEKIGVSVEWKLRKLKGLVDAGLLDVKDKQGEMIGVQLVAPQLALTGIDIMNKMQGHYAPEKSENKVSFEEEAKQIKDLTKEYERDY